MGLYKELRREIREKRQSDKLTKSERITLEQAIFKDLIKKEAVCRKCGRKRNLTLEHIVPKDILKSFGVDIDREIICGNYALACYICNAFKGNRLDFSVPETKEVLLKLLQRV